MESNDLPKVQLDAIGIVSSNLARSTEHFAFLGVDFTYGSNAE